MIHVSNSSAYLWISTQRFFLQMFSVVQELHNLWLLRGASVKPLLPPWILLNMISTSLLSACSSSCASIMVEPCLTHLCSSLKAYLTLFHALKTLGDLSLEVLLCLKCQLCLSKLPRSALSFSVKCVWVVWNSSECSAAASESLHLRSSVTPFTGSDFFLSRGHTVWPHLEGRVRAEMGHTFLQRVPHLFRKMKTWSLFSVSATNIEHNKNWDSAEYSTTAYQ